MADTIQIRRGTTSAWNSANPVLALGEQGYDTTVKQFKVGDGATAWTSLPYTATQLASVPPAGNSLVAVTPTGYKLPATTETSNLTGNLLVADGARSVQLKGGLGVVTAKGGTGGWATGLEFISNAGTVKGYFGALGSAEDLTNLFIGTSHSDPTVKFFPATKETEFAGPVEVEGQSIKQGFINVASYGLFTNATVTTATINAAIAALGDNQTLFFPDGNYTVNDELLVDAKNNIRIYTNSAKITQDGTTKTTFHLRSCTNASIEGFTLVGKGTEDPWAGAATGWSGVAGIHLNGCTNCSVIHNTLTNHAGGGIVWSSSCSNLRISGNAITGMGDTRIVIQDNGSDFAIGATGQSIVSPLKSNGITITDNYCSGHAFGIAVSSALVDSFGGIISGNIIDDIPGQHGIYVQDVQDMIVSHNTFNRTALIAIKKQFTAYEGTATAGTTTTLTTNRTLCDLTGSEVLILTGPGAGDKRTIASNTIGANSVLTVTSAFSTTITTSSTYRIMPIVRPGVVSANVITNCQHGISVASLGGLVRDAHVTGNTITQIKDRTYLGTATAGTTTTLTTNKKLPDLPDGSTVTILTGPNAGLTRTISSNTAVANGVLTVSVAFPTAITSASTYRIDTNAISGDGIFLGRCVGMVVSDNSIKQSKRYGIYGDYVSGVISDCTITRTDEASVFCNMVDDLRLQSVTIEDGLQTLLSPGGGRLAYMEFYRHSEYTKANPVVGYNQVSLSSTLPLQSAFSYAIYSDANIAGEIETLANLTERSVRIDRAPKRVGMLYSPSVGFWSDSTGNAPSATPIYGEGRHTFYATQSPETASPYVHRVGEFCRNVNTPVIDTGSGIRTWDGLLGWICTFATAGAGLWAPVYADGGRTFTVATLPAASAGALRRFVRDSSVAASGNFGAVVAGGGANTVPVYSDLTNWRIG